MLKKLNNWQKNVPWLSHYEEACRTNSFVTYRDTYVPPQEHQPPPMSTDDHVSNHTQHEDSRSYNPYLIAYHEDTNTFTYKDPWVEVTHQDVSNSNYNENYVNEQNSTPQWSAPTNDTVIAPTANANNTTEYHNHHQHQEVISSPQPQHEQHYEAPQPVHQNDLTNNHVNHVAENPPQQPSSPAVVEKVVEHVTEEVSLSRDRVLTLTRPLKMT